MRLVRMALTATCKSSCLSLSSPVASISALNSTVSSLSSPSSPPSVLSSSTTTHQTPLLAKNNFQNQSNVASTRRLLFILDLNGTLMHRVTRPYDRMLARTHPQYRSYDCTVNGHPIYFRPGHRNFLKTLFRLGEVAIWTSAMCHNALPMVEETLKGVMENEELDEELESKHNDESKSAKLRHKLLFLWAQEQCEVCPVPGRGKPDFRKNLFKVWEQFPQFDANTTIVIDDSPSKLIYQPNNLLCIPEFIVTNPQVNHSEDQTLEILEAFLTRLVMEPEPLLYLREQGSALFPIQPQTNPTIIDTMTLELAKASL